MRFIRMYGNSVQGAFGSYMEQSMSFFDQQTRQFMDQIGAPVDSNPMNVFAEMTRKNMDLWARNPEEFLQGCIQSRKTKRLLNRLPAISLSLFKFTSIDN